MVRIKRFIECLLPVTLCNLKCSYCYVLQERRRTNELPKFKYDVKTIAAALSKERLGGISYISICGAGETMIPVELVDIVRALLANGHYVNITTNGTQTTRFNELMEMPTEYRSRLHFAFSFHYLELIKRKQIDVFFNNIKKVRAAGCSFVVQLNMVDEYIPHLDKIRSICVREVGAPPQIAATRNELTTPFSLLTNLSKARYHELGKKFASPLYDFTLKNFMVKRKEYCYAGKWSGVLNLATGEMRRCYSDPLPQNIFADVTKPIKFEAMGKSCVCSYCVNSSHFLSLGVIPFKMTPSYAGLRNREIANWYTPKMRKFLSGKLIYANINLELLIDLLRQLKRNVVAHIRG
ncbi:MAG: radical SAM protein [bacterium]